MDREKTPSRTDLESDDRGFVDWLRKKRRALTPAKTNEAVAALLFLAPALTVLVLFRVVPIFSAVITSFRDLGVLVTTNANFIGLENYQTLFTSPQFLNSMQTTVLFVLVVVPLQTAAALALAVLLTQSIPGAKAWRLFFFIPFSVPLGISALIWGVALRPDGPVNAVLVAIGIDAQPFLTSTSQALPSIMIIVSWVGVGYWMVFLIAGLQDIPAVYLEAAAIDGAGPWRIFFRIVLPLMRRPLAFVLVANTVANFILFAPVQILTSGGPQQTTNLIMFDVYRNAFVLGNRAIASAEVVVLMIVMLAIVIFQFRLLSEEGDD